MEIGIGKEDMQQLVTGAAVPSLLRKENTGQGSIVWNTLFPFKQTATYTPTKIELLPACSCCHAAHETCCQPVLSVS